MGLKDRLAEIQTASSRIHNEYCAFQNMLLALNPEDKKAVDDAFARNIPTRLIIAARRKEGIKTSSDSMRLHRSGRCKCPKK
jgi:hypothetical protein